MNDRTAVAGGAPITAEAAQVNGDGDGNGGDAPGEPIVPKSPYADTWLIQLDIRRSLRPINTGTGRHGHLLVGVSKLGRAAQHRSSLWPAGGKSQVGAEGAGAVPVHSQGLEAAEQSAAPGTLFIDENQNVYRKD
jgi:hypothetical protein